MIAKFIALGHTGDDLVSAKVNALNLNLSAAVTENRFLPSDFSTSRQNLKRRFSFRDDVGVVYLHVFLRDRKN